MLCCHDIHACCQADTRDGSLEMVTPHYGARGNTKIGEFCEALKLGGGVVLAPSADKNKLFLSLLDNSFPELKIYRSGKIQTSPGVEEIENSPTEYYRTVGAMIALLACYLMSKEGDIEGLQMVSHGERGPMSMDKVPGKFINIGNKPEDYKKFCDEFAKFMKSEEDWWAMLVFLAVHDVGKSDEFRARVNATLPKDQRSDNHDKALSQALKDPDLLEDLLPSVKKLGLERTQKIADGFDTNFQLPQLGQGEIAVCSLRGLLDLNKQRLHDGALVTYLYHSIFDIAGASCREDFIYPLALVPVYVGFSGATVDLMNNLKEDGKPDEHSLYFDFLYTNFKKAYPEYEGRFSQLCESKIFREEVGIVVLRILALTRNTYKNPGAVLGHLLTNYQYLTNEMAGNTSGPQTMLYYGPDMLRMGLGDDLQDDSGDNMYQALGGMEALFRSARELLPDDPAAEARSFELNVQPIVTAIKAAGKEWHGGSSLREVCKRAKIVSNEFRTEGIVEVPPAEKKE